MESFTDRRRDTRRGFRSGSALIEMLGIVPLMFIFILFSIFLCRWLVYQGRILAAGRTAAWLVSRAQNPAEAASRIQGADFADRLLEWHFIATGPNRGVVAVEAPVITDGILNEGQVQAALDELRTPLDVEEERFPEPEPETDTTVVAQKHRDAEDAALKESEAFAQNTGAESGGGLFGLFMSGVLQYLTRDFKRVEVRVNYWMPAAFEIGALERLMGHSLQGDRESPPAADAALQRAHSSGALGAGTYVLLSRGRRTTSVMPILDPGRDGGIGGAIGSVVDKVDKLLDSVKKATSSDGDLYRPMVTRGNVAVEIGAKTDEVMQKEFYALLVYEQTDTDHKAAR